MKAVPEEPLRTFSTSWFAKEFAFVAFFAAENANKAFITLVRANMPKVNRSAYPERR